MEFVNCKYFNNLVFLLFLSFCIGCGTGPGTDEIDDVPGTFDQNPTFELRLHSGQLYAGTDGGLFRKSIDPSVTEWESLGLGNAAIRTFLVFSNEEILASATYEDRSQNTIAKTTNTGGEWFRFRNGYSEGAPFRSERLRVPQAMDIHPSDSKLLFAGGPGTDVARSTDKGNSWELIFGTWENLGFLYFINVDHNNPNRVWAGGRRAGFSDLLIGSSDIGKTWQGLEKQIISNVETIAYDLLIKTGDSNTLIVGLAGGLSPARIIRKSTDGGQNWTTVYEGINTLTMAHSARDPETIYASGQNAAGSLFFIQSDDFGDTWQQVSVPGTPDGIRVNDMVSVIVNGREVLYFGTNKGVYSYSFEE